MKIVRPLRRSKLTKSLIFYLVFATLLPALHLGFAKHSHRYDLATKQYFDVLNMGPGGSSERTMGHPLADSSLTQPETDNLKLFRCAVSNGLVLSSIQIECNNIAINTYFGKSRAFSVECEYRPQEIITIAPKQSPPTYA